MTDTAPLTVDPARVGNCHGFTDIFIRAQHDGAWGSYDIAELDRPSLQRFLRSRGGANEWAEGVVMILLGHPPLDTAPAETGEAAQ